MLVERPDLSDVTPEVRAYISALEEQIASLQSEPSARLREEIPAEPSEPPTPLNVITISRAGLAKRTPRHFYSRQRRGGMGVFDLEGDRDDPPAILTIADENENLLLITNFGRAFRLPVSSLAETPVRARGKNLMSLFQFRPYEQIVAALPTDRGQYLALASQRGWVRRIPAARVGAGLIPGMSFHDVQQGGHLCAACWTQGDEELFMATQQGVAIRFAESQVHKSGSLGLRVDLGDKVVGITAVKETSHVFLLSHDGKGSLRLMSGFRLNKAPGTGGKTALKTDKLVAITAVAPDEDLFIISQLGKIIRFNAAEIPAKEGVVQGVSCITLRNDEATAVVATR
jgi:DNA gyrase subunit A